MMCLYTYRLAKPYNIIIGLISLFEETITDDVPDEFGIHIVKCSMIKPQLHTYIGVFLLFFFLRNKQTEDEHSNYILGKIIQKNMHRCLNQVIIVIIECKLE